jgi:hypothetical protein
VKDLRVTAVPAVAVMALLPTTALVIVCAIAVLVALTFVPLGWERVRLDNERRRRELPPLPAQRRGRALAGTRHEKIAPAPDDRAATSSARSPVAGETSAGVSVPGTPY